MDLTLRLREATGELHRRIEELPLARAMVGGHVGREKYLRLLGQMVFLHEALERELEAHPTLHSVYRPGMARWPALRSDLAALGSRDREAPQRVISKLMDSFGTWSRTSPGALLGPLYILEGSRMGSMMLFRPLAQALGVSVEPGQGLDYHIEGLAERPVAWQRFKSALLGLELSPQIQEQLVVAAVSTMSALYALYESLEPSCTGEPDSLTAMSPVTVQLT